MCGIIFTNDLHNVKNFKQKVLAHTSYRGPDLNKFLIKNKFFFGFNYLSITGKFKGSPQPFERNENLLIFNGEIFNYKSLKKSLIKRHVKFKTDSDTEVLAACLEYYGVEKTHKIIKGMWSFVYFDNKKKNIIISKDRIGIKPLFYLKTSTKFYFSSSIETIYKFFHKKIKINKIELKDFIQNGNIFLNQNTFFNRIKVFPSSTYCILKKNKFKFNKYWSLDIKEDYNLKNINSFKKNFEKIIINHNNYKVKTAIPLSSGLDSNYLLSKFKDKKNLFCYSLKNYQNDNESYHINKIIKSSKSKFFKHKFIDCKNITKKKIDNFITKLDYPIRSFQPFFQYLIREQAKKDGVRILLSGDGADEIFGGYVYAVKYRLASLLAKKQFNRVLKFAKDMEKFTGISAHDLIDQAKSVTIQENALKKFLHKRIVSTHIPYWLYIDDFISMKNSIENRVPYLDSDIVSMMFRWKEEYFFFNSNNKFLLRKIFPKNVILSKKKFHKPGNYSYVYNILSKEIKRITKSTFIKKLKLNKLNFEYLDDLKSLNQKSADKWFRVYFLYNWLKSKKIDI